MRGKKFVTAVILCSVLFSMTGCGMTGRFMRAFGKVLERRMDDDRMEDPGDELGKGEAEDRIPVQVSPGKDAEATPENKPEKSPRPQSQPREGVTSLDDIFSGENPSSPKEETGQGNQGYGYADPEDGTFSYDGFVAANLEKCKEDLAADQGSVQSDVDSDTVQWMNATYALITESNQGDRTLVGGMERNASNAVFMRYQLYTGWGIEDQESADEIMEWLRSQGHRQGYMEYVDALEEKGFFSLEKEEFDAVVKENFGEFGSYTINVLGTVYECHKTYGDKGILAWDLCRLNQVASWCYVAGYYTLDEALEIQYQNSLLMQENFLSWDDLMESYLYGFRYWKGESGGSSANDTGKRRNIYESLKAIPQGPYSNDFKEELQRSWAVAE